MKECTRLFVIVPLLCAMISCQKEIPDIIGDTMGGNGGTGGTGSSNFPYYFIGTVAGAAVKYEANDLNSRYGCGTSQPENSLGTTDYDVYEGTVLMDMLDPTKSTISVHILKHFDHEPSAAERSAMIRVGTYIYGHGDVSPMTTSGATIDYIDANGNNWFSETGSQTASIFNITELVDNTNGTSAKIFKATFSCRLYSLDGSKNIQVTNATVRGKILSP
jgi:hypothetical protein